MTAKTWCAMKDIISAVWFGGHHSLRAGQPSRSHRTHSVLWWSHATASKASAVLIGRKKSREYLMSVVATRIQFWQCRNVAYSKVAACRERLRDILELGWEISKPSLPTVSKCWYVPTSSWSIESDMNDGRRNKFSTFHTHTQWLD